MNEFLVKGENTLKKRWNDQQTAKRYFEERFGHQVWNFMHWKEVRLINSYFQKYKPGKILDLATGPARVAKDLKYFDKGWAVDYSQEMLKVARKELLNSDSNWQISKQDAFSLELPSGFFDAVVSFRFLRHFDAEDRGRLYKEIRRVLKDGGLLIFEALNTRMDKYLFRPQFTGAADKSIYDQLYLASDIEKELRKNGFSLVELVPNICHGKLYYFLSSILRKQEPFLFWIFNLLEKIGQKQCFQWEVIATKEKTQ